MALARVDDETGAELQPKGTGNLLAGKLDVQFGAFLNEPVADFDDFGHGHGQSDVSGQARSQPFIG